LIFNYFFTDSVGFEETLIKLLNSEYAIFVNVGLVTMLYLDNYITKKIVKDDTQQEHAGLIIGSFILITSLTVFTEHTYKLHEWFRISYIFIIFLACLTVYKAKTLNIRRNSLQILSTKIKKYGAQIIIRIYRDRHNISHIKIGEYRLQTHAYTR
jgi:hypothetical protein